MDKYCIFCGSVLSQGRCEKCSGGRKIENKITETGKTERLAPSTLRRPMPLQERRRQMAEAERAETFETIPPEYVERNEAYSYVYERDMVTEPENRVVLPEREHRIDDVSTDRPPVTVGQSNVREPQKVRREIPDFSVDIENEQSEVVLSPQGNGVSDNERIPFHYFVSDYFREPGKVVSAVARKRDIGVGIMLFLTTICLSAFGTLIFGTLYLDDFFARWLTTGIFVPVIAFVAALLYGRLYVALSSRRRDPFGARVVFGELFSVVATSAVFPNLLLLLTGALAPMDKSMRIFQFFALLLAIAWILSLVFSLFTVYGCGFSFGGLLLTVIFGFFVFTMLRAVWVWFLTGDFTYALHIPFSIFFTG